MKRFILMLVLLASLNFAMFCGDPCDSDTDCADGYVCFEHDYIFINDGANCIKSCLDGGDCESNEICASGMCLLDQDTDPEYVNEYICNCDKDCYLYDMGYVFGGDPSLECNSGTCGLISEVECAYIIYVGSVGCEDWEICNSHVCELSPVRCYDNEDCDGTEVCTDHSCESLSCGSCEYAEDHGCVAYDCCEDADCASNEVCEENECVYECLSDSDCNYDQVCSDHECQDLDCGSCEYPFDNECVDYDCCEDADCDAGETCESHHCIEGLECEQNSDCGDQELCQDNECVSVECVDHEDCGFNERCDNNGCTVITCICGYVEDYECIEYECCSDNDCDAGEQCEGHACTDILITIDDQTDGQTDDPTDDQSDQGLLNQTNNQTSQQLPVQNSSNISNHHTIVPVENDTTDYSSYTVPNNPSNNSDIINNEPVTDGEIQTCALPFMIFMLLGLFACSKN